MYILGITTMTDSSAVLFKNNRLIGAVEEERFTRVKHQKGFPLNSINFLLSKEGITIDQIDEVGVFWDPWKIFDRIKYIFYSFLSFRLFYIRVVRGFSVFFGSNNSSGWINLLFLKKIFKKNFKAFSKKISYFDHHDCHIASAHFISGYNESAVLIMDGAGETACTTLAYVKNNKITAIKKMNYLTH